MMKKMIFGLILSTSLITSPLFANTKLPTDQFGCLQQMEKRVVDGWGVEKMLSLESCMLRNEDMPTITSFLAKRPDVQGLDLDNNIGITSEGYETLAASNLTYLSLNNNFVHDKEAIEISKITSLTFLYADHNFIGAEGSTALAKLPSLKVISLADNDIEDAGVSAFAKNPSLVVLFVDNNGISSQGASTLAPSGTLRLISLENNFIGNNGAIELANNSDFDILLLSGNHIGDKGAAALANKSKASYFDLDHNDLGNQAAFAFANSPNVQAINVLWVGYNRIGTEGLQALESSAIHFLGTTGNLSDDTSFKTQRMISSSKLPTTLNKSMLRVICAHHRLAICK